MPIKVRLFVLSLSLIITSVLAQETGITVAERPSPETAEELEGVDMLLDLAWEYRLSNPDSTIFYCEAAIAFAEEINNPKARSKAHNFMGLGYYYLGKPSLAYNHHQLALINATEHSDSLQLGHALNSIGRIYCYHGEQAKGLEHLQKAKDIFIAIRDPQGYGYAIKSLAELYSSQRDYDRALDYLSEVLDLRKAHGNTRGIISTHQEIAQIYTQKKMFADAMESLEAALVIARKLDDPFSAAELYLGLSEISLKTKKINEARQQVSLAKQMAGNTHNQQLNAKILVQSANLELEARDYDEAEKYFLKGLALARSGEYLKIQKDALHGMYLVTSKRKETQRALEFYTSFVAVRDSLRNIEMTRELEKLQSRAEIQEKEKEYQLLKEQEEQKAALLAQKEKITDLLMVIAGLSVLVMIIMTIAFWQKLKTNRRLKSKNYKIELQNKEILKQKNLIQQQNEILVRQNEIFNNSELERNNMMHIVAHDLKSPLNRIKSLVELINLTGKVNKEQEKYLEMIQEVSGSGVKLIRDLLDVYELENTQKILQPDQINLQKFLEDRKNVFTTEAQVKKINIQIEKSPVPVNLISDLHFLTRIVDNLISNSIKYSHPKTNVFLRAYKNEDGGVSISVKDEGQGFSEQDKIHLFKRFKKLSALPTAGESSNGMGLAIVKGLVDKLHGTIDLKSDQRTGSEFIISFPNDKQSHLSMTGSAS